MMLIDIFRYSSDDQWLFIATDCTITEAQSGHGDVADVHWLIVLFEFLVLFDYGWLIAQERAVTDAAPSTHR